MTEKIDNYIQHRTFTSQLFDEPVSSRLGLIITIPALAEKRLLVALASLFSCALPDVDVEVIVVINHSVLADKWIRNINQSTFNVATKWSAQNSTSRLKFLVSKPIELPKKHAGAGLARKIAMDEAVRRLQETEIENPVIAAFDADATCSDNYLTELWKHFQTYPKLLGCTVYFEHPITNIDSFQTQAIIQYELHLRYYKAALQYANHPHAHFTVGSSMAVTRDAYVLHGGMNRRKAGEDFWFLLKLMMAGNISYLTNAIVYPSDRESFRVPFGTGRAMKEMRETQSPVFFTIRFSSFERLKYITEMVNTFYLYNKEIDDILTMQFLNRIDWKSNLAEIRKYTTDLPSFRKRFFRWFNAFMVMKFFHFLRDSGQTNVEVMSACTDLAIYHWKLDRVPNSALEMLEFFRQKKE